MWNRMRNAIIAEVLKSQGKTQTEAAFKMNRPRCRVNLEANGWVIPGPDIRRKWSEYLGLPQRVLFPTADSFTETTPQPHGDQAPRPCRSESINEQGGVAC